MNRPQNPSRNYEAMLQSIQQELEGWKAKLSAKDIRVNSLMRQQKEMERRLEATQRELEATQTKLQARESETRLEATQRELEATQTKLQAIESELKSTQSELRGTQSELRNTQSELRSVQKQSKRTQSELRKTQSELRDMQSELKSSEPELGSQMVSPKDGMVMLYVPAGTFLMGSRDNDPDAKNYEKPQHEVYLDGYWIDKTPVTNAMFAKFVQETGYDAGTNWRSKAGSGREHHPVVYVSWNDAQAYAKWAGRRLPTEAEWEKAAGGTDGRKYPWGNESPTPLLANTSESRIRDTTPVGKYFAGASPYGALDMAGNVWEWCHDTFEANYYASSPNVNPQGPMSRGTKVLRGGSWLVTARNSRVRDRFRYDADCVDGDWGFRCALSPL